ncbi:hypothetical protein BCU68_09150 [Vibrio sp. 10N.286.49.B3]|nr:hypothetical protein BCU68_09150 [Vibrio sp. 10N.286.49.B3]
MNKKVSIIVAAYNASKYIVETILSVMGQSYDNWELIIINDGSTDNTAEIVSQYTNDKRIILVTQKNTGAVIARNNGFLVSSGEYIIILDADDTLLSDKVELQVNILDSADDVGVVYGDTWHCDEFLNKVSLESEKFPGQQASGNVFEKIINGNLFAVHAAMFRRSLIDRSNIHIVDEYQIADWELWVRLSEKTNFLYLNSPVCLYRLHASMSARTDDNSTQIRQRLGVANVIRKKQKYFELNEKLKSTFEFNNARFCFKFRDYQKAKELSKVSIKHNMFNVNSIILYILSSVKNVS